MQVLTIVVQNTVPYHDLGVATSGVTFLRTLGSAFGVALFGTVYSNSLQSQLEKATLPPGLDPRLLESPKGVQALPSPLRELVIGGYTEALQTVFAAAVPVGLLVMVIALFLKQVPLRDTARAAASDLGEGFSVPEGDNRVDMLKLAISKVWERKGTTEGAQVLRSAGLRIDPANAWCLSRVALFNEYRGQARLRDIAELYTVPASVLRPAFLQCLSEGYLREVDGELKMTPRGLAEFDRISAAWRDWLESELSGWEHIGDDEFDRAVDQAARELLSEDVARI
jgi:hypothetical protein